MKNKNQFSYISSFVRWFFLIIYKSKEEISENNPLNESTAFDLLPETICVVKDPTKPPTQNHVHINKQKNIKL